MSWITQKPRHLLTESWATFIPLWVTTNKPFLVWSTNTLSLGENKIFSLTSEIDFDLLITYLCALLKHCLSFYKCQYNGSFILKSFIRKEYLLLTSIYRRKFSYLYTMYKIYIVGPTNFNLVFNGSHWNVKRSSFCIYVCCYCLTERCLTFKSNLVYFHFKFYSSFSRP